MFHMHICIFQPEEGDEDDLSLFTPEQDVKMNPELTEEQRGEVMKVLEEFRDVFIDVPGLTNLGKHSITLTTEEPIHSKPYSLPHAMKKEVEKELDDMLQLGIIEPSTSSYSLPIVVVRKPDGSNRVCVDFQKLNKVTVFDPEPMPQPEQIFAKLEKDQYFSTYEFSKGYWQVPMTDEDKPYTAFVTHKGLHQFKAMAFRTGQCARFVQ